MKKQTWCVHAQAVCEDCGVVYSNYKNAQALAAKHAKVHGHLVRVDIGLISEYDGRKTKHELP